MLVCNISWKHKYRNLCDGQAEYDNNLWEVCLIRVIRMLIVDEKICVENEGQEANDDDDYK